MLLAGWIYMKDSGLSLKAHQKKEWIRLDPTIATRPIAVPMVQNCLEKAATGVQ